jgi:hypothetical protein
MKTGIYDLRASGLASLAPQHDDLHANAVILRRREAAPKDEREGK